LRQLSYCRSVWENSRVSGNPKVPWPLYRLLCSITRDRRIHPLTSDWPSRATPNWWRTTISKVLRQGSLS